MASGEAVTSRWLSYCRSIVGDHEHLRLCAALGGSAPGDGVFPLVRWPGYLGSDYDEGKLLWVNIVHRNLTERWEPREAKALASATEEWAAGRSDDAAYLEASRRGYLSGLGPGGWNVGRDLRHLTAALGWRLSDVAYANAARCQVVPGGGHSTVQDRLVMFCQGWAPIRSLAEELRPGLIYVTALAVMPLLSDLPGDPLVVGIGQRGQRSPLGWSPPTNEDRWAAIAAEYWKRRRASPQTGASPSRRPDPSLLARQACPTSGEDCDGGDQL